MAKIIDSLDDYTKDELLAYAEQFGTDANKSISKKDLVARLLEDGVTLEVIAGYNKELEEYDAKALGLHPLTEDELAAVEAPVVEDEEEEDLILVVMTRSNGTYEIRGHRFTRDHPFALVKESDADYLIEVDGGFRIASPKEARAYYS